MALGSRRTLIGATGVISGVTAISRVLGLIRDGIVAAVLGDKVYNDIFQIAFSIPNMARRVLGEGALSAFIVPVITGVRRKEGEEAAWRTTCNTFNLLAVITLALTIVGCVFSKQLFFIYGGARFRIGDASALEQFGGAATLMQLGGSITCIMFPFLMFLALVALLMGILHSLNHFLTPALGSIMINITMIVAGVIYHRATPVRFLYVLAWAVMIGAVIRLLILFPPLIRRGFRWKPIFDRREAGFRELGSKMPAAVFGTAIAQVNIAVTMTLANFTGVGSITYLVYGQRLIQLPRALIATALSTALLPQLSSVVVDGERRDLQRLMAFAFRAISLIFIPATVGLMALGHPVVEIIFQRANWSDTATQNTTIAVFFYAFGLYPTGICRIIIPLYYARKDMMTPVKVGVVSMIVNAVLGLSLMMTPLSFGGLALASSVATVLNAILLWRGIRRHYGPGLVGHVTGMIVRVLICSALMGAVCWYGFRATDRWLEPTGTLSLLLVTMVWVGIGMLAYAISSRLAGLWDRSTIYRLFRR